MKGKLYRTGYKHKVFRFMCPLPCLSQGTAEREAKFQKMKREAAEKDPFGSTGSFFAFHGSRAENWHGILREGLKNMSGAFCFVLFLIYRRFWLSKYLWRALDGEGGWGGFVKSCVETTV